MCLPTLTTPIRPFLRVAATRASMRALSPELSIRLTRSKLMRTRGSS